MSIHCNIYFRENLSNYLFQNVFCFLKKILNCSSLFKGSQLNNNLKRQAKKGQIDQHRNFFKANPGRATIFRHNRNDIVRSSGGRTQCGSGKIDLQPQMAFQLLAELLLGSDDSRGESQRRLKLDRRAIFSPYNSAFQLTSRGSSVYDFQWK